MDIIMWPELHGGPGQTRTVVCNLVKKQVSALSDTRDSLSHVSESAENWLASQLPPMTDDQSQFFGHG